MTRPFFYFLVTKQLIPNHSNSILEFFTLSLYTHITLPRRSIAMRVTVLQENLAHGLSIVSRAVSPRSTLPVLANVLVATDEGRLRLSATNLELGITCWIGA